MTSCPAVSILMPARNAAATLDEALASIVGQTFGDWELIVVDDGSTDGTADLLARWCARDARIHAARCAAGQGIVAALNDGLHRARGELIARMDADDISLPERLEKQVALIRAGEFATVGCRIEYFPREVLGGGALRYETWINGLTTHEEHARDIFVECPLAHPTFLLRRELLEAAGGYQARGWPEDYDLLLRLWLRGGRFAKVPEVLFRWRESADRTSRTHDEYREEAFVRCKVHYLRQSYLAGDRPAMVWGAGPVGKRLARELLAAGTPVLAFVDLDPRKIGQRVYGSPVLSPIEALARRGEAFGLGAVGQPGAREEIRAMVAKAGWEEGKDFTCAA